MLQPGFFIYGGEVSYLGYVGVILLVKRIFQTRCRAGLMANS